jgi:hypothetical protein
MSVSVPVPALVSPPVPPIAPDRVAAWPLVSIVPPPTLRVTVRAELKPAPYCKVPPPKLRPPATAPRLPSLETESAPPLIAVPPK